MSASTKTIGVIGLGSIGLRHAVNLRALGCNVRAWDPDMKRRLQFNGVLWDMDEVMGSDAVVVASPTPLHADQLYKVMSAAKPCFVEKPIGDNYIDIDLALCKEVQFQQQIMVGYNLRFHSCVKQARAWLEAGLIGQPMWANFTCAQYNDKPAYLRDGVILNWSHEIDLALYLLGPAKVAASSTRLTDGKDDLTDILLTHDNGARSNIHLDYITNPEQRGFTIGGSNGVIAADLTLRSVVRIVDGDRPFVYHDQGDSYDKNYVEEMQAFLDRIDGKKTIGATGEEGLAVLKICLEVREQAGLK